jgi:2-alkyl-3-oxoalkanoate reductase
MRTLVTGATGLVGSHVVDELLRRNEQVKALVRDPARAADLENRGIEVHIGDVRDAAAFAGALRDVDVVQHCAAAVGHFTKKEIYETNLGGVRNLLEACRRQGGKHVVLVSSVNVLGTRNLNPATEDLPYRYSRDPAADVKIDAEQLALDYGRQGVAVTIVRPGFVYGPGDTRNLPKLADAIVRGKFRFMGARDNVVPIVHVEDVAQALVLAGKTAETSEVSKTSEVCRIYNITDGSRTTIGELVDFLTQQLGCPRPQKVLPYWIPYLACVVFDGLNKLGLRKRPGPVTRASLRFLGTSRFVDISRARNELGYSPRVSYRDGMAAALQWIKEHQLEAVHEPATPCTT